MYFELKENKPHGTKDNPFSIYHIENAGRSFQIPVHWHDEFEIIYVKSGLLTVSISGEFNSPVEHTLTFTPKVKQCILQFMLYTDTSTGIKNITTIAQPANNNVYDLSGRVVKSNAKAEDLKSLNKGIYVFNNKKYVTK